MAKRLWILFISTLVVSVVQWFCSPKVSLHLAFSAENAGAMQLYFPDNGTYAEHNSLTKRFKKGRNYLSFTFAGGGQPAKVRLDFDQAQGNKLLVREIILKQRQHRTLRVTNRNYANLLSKSPELQFVSQEPDGFQVYTLGNDGNVELTIQKYSSTWSVFIDCVARTFILSLAFLVLACFAMNFFSSRSSWRLRLTRFFYLLVLALVFITAIFSQYNVHPDEYGHTPAVEYYIDHSVPPVIGTQGYEHTYQYPWGYSRLDNRDISYFIAGKCAWLLDFIPCETYLKARFFNVILFALLVKAVFLNFSVCAPLAVLLLTPQIWYIFSYCNNDAFPLFLSSVLALTTLSVFADNKNSLTLYQRLFLGVAAGLLLVEKQNFYVFVLFLGLIYLVKEFFIQKISIYTFLQKYWSAVLIALLIFGVRVALDVSLNGLNRESTRLEAREALAAPQFRPSVFGTPQSYETLHLKQKGHPLSVLFSRYAWHARTLESFLGRYGYESLNSPGWYYKVMSILLCFLFISLLWSVRSSYQNLLVTGLFIFCAFLMIAISLNHSWTYDLQRQGRYLFPIVPCLIVVLGLNRTPVRPVFFLTASLGIYSFITAGLMNFGFDYPFS
jgi:hypothetical protein